MALADDNVEISREQLAKLSAAADELAGAREYFDAEMTAWEEERTAHRRPSDQALMSLLMWSAIGVLVGLVGCWNVISDRKGVFEGLQVFVVSLGVFFVIGLWRASKK